MVSLGVGEVATVRDLHRAYKEQRKYTQQRHDAYKLDQNDVECTILAATKEVIACENYQCKCASDPGVT